MRKMQSGFTLIEMMVVIGIIGILAGALFGGFTYVLKSAQRAKATEAVSNARTALERIFLALNRWPSAIREARQYGEYRVMDEQVAIELFKQSALSVDCKKKSSEVYELRGVDRCGIADPWAQEVLRKASTSKGGTELLDFTVPSGGKVRDHLIYFAVDLNDDGFVDKSEGAPVRTKVRAKAITWCAGPDGILGDCTTDKAGKSSDNVYSWQRAQEVR